MRKYILDFLKKQKPAIIYHRTENGNSIFRYLFVVWLNYQEKICSLFVVYTPIAILWGGEENASLYDRLSTMIKYHKSVSEAIVGFQEQLEEFTSYYVEGCQTLVRKVLEIKKLYESDTCHILDFDCVDLRLGIFTVLYEVGGNTDYAVLLLERKNYIVGGDKDLKFLFTSLFHKVFHIEWRA